MSRGNARWKAQVAHPHTGEAMFSLWFVVKKFNSLNFPLPVFSEPADFRHALVTGRRILHLDEK